MKRALYRYIVLFLVATAPALVDGKVYVRTEKHLYAFGERGPDTDATIDPTIPSQPRRATDPGRPPRRQFQHGEIVARARRRRQGAQWGRRQSSHRRCSPALRQHAQLATTYISRPCGPSQTYPLPAATPAHHLPTRHRYIQEPSLIPSDGRSPRISSAVVRAEFSARYRADLRSSIGTRNGNSTPCRRAQ
jgi:hypothetical protein